MYLTVCLTFLLTCYMIYRRLNKRRWDLLAKIPGTKPLPLIGHILDIVSFNSQKEKVNSLTRFFEYREGMVTLFRKAKMNILWIGREPVVFLSAPETIETILGSNTAIEKGRFYKYIKPWLGDGLVMSTGDKWRLQRKLMTPSFHFRILDSFMPIMNEQAAILVQKISEEMSTTEWIDCFSRYSKCTLDIICETSMGIMIHAQDGDSTYTEMIHNASSAISLRASAPWLDSDAIYFRTEKGRMFKNSIKYLHDVTNKVISERIGLRKAMTDSGIKDNKNDEVESKKRLAFLDLLLESGMTQEDISDQVHTFMFAGHDTTAVALTWMSFLLGLYSDIQDKLIEEVDRVFGDDKERHVTQEDLRELKYMDMVIKESQRLYPSAPGISRTTDKDTEIGGYVIPKGTECFISIYSAHHHPDHYKNPEIFDPERFSPDNSVGRHPYAFVPFSAGPRNCIGQRFAYQEEKIIMSHVLRNFRILSLHQRDQIHLVPELILKANQAIMAKFIPRT